MDKPVPYLKSDKLTMDFLEMQDWINHKYGIDQRDYSNHFGFSWEEFLIPFGISPERTKELMRTKPADMVNPVEKDAMDAARKANDQWYADYPYQDFWHFQLKVINLRRNDTYVSLNLNRQLARAYEDWQKEIAQMWLDEFGEFSNEHGNIRCWVSW